MVGIFFEEVIRRIFVEFVGNLFIAIVVIVEVQDKREGEAVIDLVPSEGFIIEVEALKDKVEQFRQSYELYPSLRPYFLLTSTAVIQIMLI